MNSILVLIAKTIAFSYMLIMVGMLHVHRVHARNKHLGVQAFPSTFFQPAGKQVFVKHDSIGIELSLHIPEILSMAEEALYHHKKYYVLLELGNKWMQRNQSVEEIYSILLSARPWKKPLHYALDAMAEQVQQRINSLNNDLSLESTEHDFFHQNLQDHLFQDSHVSDNKWFQPRGRRDVNINIDPGQIIQNFFNGVAHIFHMHSINDVRNGLKNLDKKVRSLSDFTKKFATETTSLISRLEKRIIRESQATSAALADTAIMSLALSVLSECSMALTPLMQGIIPSMALTPAEANVLYFHLQQLAKDRGVLLVINKPDQLLKLPVTTYRKDGDFKILLCVSTIVPEHGMPSFNFVNLPFRRKNGDTILWDQPEGLLAVAPSIYPRVEYVFIPKQNINSACTNYPVAFLCQAPVNSFTRCVIDLYFNRTEACSTHKATMVFPQIIPSPEHLLVYFPESTEMLIPCVGEVFEQRLEVAGLVSIEDRPNCLLTSSMMTYFTNGRKPLFTINSNLSKTIPSFLYPDPPVMVQSSNISESLTDIIATFNHSNTNEAIFGTTHDLYQYIFIATTALIVITFITVFLVMAYRTA